jgi:hypothetical protein
MIGGNRRKELLIIGLNNWSSECLGWHSLAIVLLNNLLMSFKFRF